MMEIAHGIDISNHQATASREAGTPIDWLAVARDGIRYCWCKATEGPGFRDAYLVALINGARAAGIPAGAYHFARPGDPVQQARWFASHAKLADSFARDALRPMLDVEDTGVDDAWIAAWLKEFRAITGVRRVIVYANAYFWSVRLKPDRWIDEDILLWIADYNGDPGRLRWNHPQLALHQHTETGRVVGFPSNVDKNVTVNGFAVNDLLIAPTVPEVDEPMFQHITLPPTAEDEVREIVIGLPWQGGAGGVANVWATIGSANADLKLHVAHWQVHDDAEHRRAVGLVDDGTVLAGLTNTSGQQAPRNTSALVVDYTGALGGYVLLEAAR